MGTTTKMTSIFDEDAQALMTGEMYPLYSSTILTKATVTKLLQIFYEQKLNRYYACIQKAKIVANHFRISHIHLGSLMLDSAEEGVSYGYHYNPPLELHAWVQVYTSILDFALPGTIEKGLNTKDDVGPFLIGREPVILAGEPAPWMHYVTHEIVPVENVELMDIEKAKDLINGNISKGF